MKDQHILKKLIQLRGSIEHVIFKSFIKEYPLPEKLSQSHAVTIMILNHHKGESMSKLSKMVGMEKGSFTSVADRLIKLGYVVSERSEKDRRRYILKLTDKGVEFAKTFGKNHEKYIEAQIGALNDNDEKEFVDTVDTLLEKFEVLLLHSKFEKPTFK